MTEPLRDDTRGAAAPPPPPPPKYAPESSNPAPDEELQQESKAVEKVMFSNFSETELCLLRRFFGQILDNISELPVNR